MKTILLLLIPFFLFGNALSPDAIAILKGRPLHGTAAKRQMRSGAPLSGMLLIDDRFEEDKFHAIGGEIFSRSEEVLTVSIPLSSLSKLKNIPGAKLFTPARKVKPAMDKAIPAGNAVNVYTGEGYSRTYTGSGVIVGVIDGGFDFTHLAFRDGNNNTRISRVWDQNAAGTPPRGYNYGAVFTTQQEILNQQYCVNSEANSHGNHVAGIAGGKRGVPNESSMGVAHSAELVFVSTNFYDNGIVDGMRWIFEYADSVGKPAVINLSLGIHFGPHDGSSSIDRVIEAFTGEGKIVVGAAGNEREKAVHVSKSIYNDTLKSFMTLPYQSDGDYGLQQVVAWGEKGQDYTLGIAIYSGTELVSKSTMYSASEISNIGYLYGTLSTNSGDMVEYELFGDFKSPLNGKSEVICQVTSSAPSVMRGDENVAVLISGEQGTVHAWTILEDSEIKKGFFGDDNLGMVAGDSLYSVGEVGGTGRATISVGAFTSKTSFVNSSGTVQDAHGSVVGEIAPFSSMGPTLDGRMKPDITAPGDVMISSLRGDYTPDLRSYISDIIDGSPFGGYSGTSMSTPFVTGAVALMLQADPTLTPSEVKEILTASATQDEFTDAGTESLWGAGKINIDKALQLVEQNYANGAPTQQRGAGEIKIRSVHAGEFEMIVTNSVVQKPIDVVVYDLRGRAVLDFTTTPSQSKTIVPFSASLLASGTYVYSITGAGVSTYGSLVYVR